MSDEPKPAINPTPAPSRIKEARAHVTNIRTHLKTLEGADGVNPFVWARDNLNKLEAQLGDKDKSVAELAAGAILKLSAMPDCKVDTEFVVAPLHPSVEQEQIAAKNKKTVAQQQSRV